MVPEELGGEAVRVLSKKAGDKGEATSFSERLKGFTWIGYDRSNLTRGEEAIRKAGWDCSAPARLPPLMTGGFADDDELLVRASAVLKSQGPENWSRGRPGPHWARTNSRSARDASAGKSGGKPLVGWRRVAPQVRGTSVVLFCL